MAGSLVIIPTYNEAENIEKLVRNIFAQQRAFEVLVVDDNSPDGTAKLVKSLQEEFIGQIHLLERPGKNGLGTAYIAGFKWALERDYAYIFEMDADFSHAPNDLIRLYNACAKGGAVLMSYIASKYVRFITGLDIADTTAGFICYRREVLEQITLDKIKFVGYAFQIEMKFKAHLLGFNIVEVPVIFVDRTKGTSKMSTGIFSEAVFGVLGMKFKSLFKSYDI